MGDEATDKLKILHLLSQRPDSTGSGIYLQAMIRGAGARGHRNFMVAGVEADDARIPDSISPSDCEFVRFNGPDLTGHIVGMSDAMPYASRRFRDLTDDELREYEGAFSKVILRAIDRFRPDVLHSHHLWMLTALVQRLHPDLPLVTSCHGSDLRQFMNCPHLGKRVLGGCRGIDAILALTSAQKSDIVSVYGIEEEKISVVGAGYDDQLFLPGAKPPPDPIQLVYAGKLSLAKGVPWMLRALAGIRDPEWRLHLVGGGSGPETDTCLELARQLSGRVRIHGAVNQRQLADTMRRAHIFILPSLFEGLPLVVLEALASGCRLVTTDLPGVAEILGDHSTDIVSTVPLPRLEAVDMPLPEDEKPFETSLQAAILEQMSGCVRETEVDPVQIARLAGRYTWPQIFQKVHSLYHKAKSGRRSQQRTGSMGDDISTCL